MFPSEMLPFKGAYIEYLRDWSMVRNRAVWEFPCSFEDFASDEAFEDGQNARAASSLVLYISHPSRYV